MTERERLRMNIPEVIAARQRHATLDEVSKKVAALLVENEATLAEINTIFAMAKDCLAVTWRRPDDVSAAISLACEALESPMCSE